MQSSKIAHAAERKAFSVAHRPDHQGRIGEDREKKLDKLIDMAGKLLKDTAPGVTRGLKAGLYPAPSGRSSCGTLIDETDPHVLQDASC
jgi:hypothetical protein